jgi:hypothetical protein
LIGVASADCCDRSTAARGLVDGDVRQRSRQLQQARPLICEAATARTAATSPTDSCGTSHARRRTARAEGPASSKPIASLVLQGANAARPPGQWKDDDYDVIADGKVVAA